MERPGIGLGMGFDSIFPDVILTWATHMFRGTASLIIIVVAGLPLYEGSKTVFGTRFPVFAIRSERMFGYDTIGPVFDFLTWSFNTMYLGTFPAKNLAGHALQSLGPNMMPNDPMYDGYKFRLVELRGDWKHHAHCFKLVNHWSCNDNLSLLQGIQD